MKIDTITIRSLTLLLGVVASMILAGCANTRIQRLSASKFLGEAAQGQQLNNFYWTTYVGRSGGRAYLESGCPALIGKGTRTTVFWIPLSELPADLAAQMRQGKNPWKIERKTDPHQCTLRIEDGRIRIEAVAPADR